MRTRTGKIGRLPQEVREELNRRLLNGETGTQLVAWLNGLPQVQAVMAAQFGGCEISEPNLSRWKAGGFSEWLAEQKAQRQSREIIAEARELAASTDGPLTDHISTMVAVHYAGAIVEWKGGMTVDLQHRLRELGKLVEDVTRLRRGDQKGAWMEIEREHMEWKRQEAERRANDQIQKVRAQTEELRLIAPNCG